MSSSDVGYFALSKAPEFSLRLQRGSATLQPLVGFSALQLVGSLVSLMADRSWSNARFVVGRCRSYDDSIRTTTVSWMAVHRISRTFSDATPAAKRRRRSGSRKVPWPVPYPWLTPVALPNRGRAVLRSRLSWRGRCLVWAVVVAAHPPCTSRRLRSRAARSGSLLRPTRR